MGAFYNEIQCSDSHNFLPNVFAINFTVGNMVLVRVVYSYSRCPVLPTTWSSFAQTVDGTHKHSSLQADGLGQATPTLTIPLHVFEGEC